MLVSRRAAAEHRSSAMNKLLRLYAVFTTYLVFTNIIPLSALKGGYENLHVYDYKAEISVGVEEPGAYVSKYSLQGLIRVQRDVNQLSVSQYKYLISLTDVKHDSYYGEDTIRINKCEPVDQSLFGNAFTAFYKPNGQLQSTEFNKNEAEWSKQIKMSIARLLQFNWSGAQKDLYKEGQMHLAHVEEKTIHGKCFVNYNTTLLKNASKANKKINLVKIIHPTKCDNFVRDFSGHGINNKASVDTVKEILDHKKTKINSVYELEIVNNQPIIKKLFNFERYHFDYESRDESSRFPFMDNPQFVKVRQTLFLKKTESGDEFLHSSEKVATNGKSQDVKLNQEQIISKVKQLLLQVNKNLDEHRLVEIKPGAEHRQLFNKIHHYLKNLDINGFEKLYSEIIGIPKTENLRKILPQILSFIGTKSSLFFIKTMIMEHKISDTDAIDVLSMFFEHIEHSEKILPELEIFLKKNNGLSPKVQQAAVQSFSHLMSKVCKDSHKSVDASMEKYVRSIYGLMEGATTVDTKLAYLTALGNTQCRGAVKYIKSLLPRQKNGSKNRERLPIIAIWMLMRLIDADDTDVLHELTKILYDENETKELRLAAYKVLVHKSDFDKEDLIEIGRRVSTNEYLKNYHLMTMRNFNQIGLLTNDALSKINPKNEELSHLALINVVLELDEAWNIEPLKSFFKLNFAKKKLVRVAFLGQFNLNPSVTSFPSSFEFEIFNVVDGTIIVDEAVYGHSNFDLVNHDENDEDRVVFADLSDLRNDRFSLHSLELSKKIINNLDIEELLKHISDTFLKPHFWSGALQTFSIPTGFGIDATYQDQKSVLLNINCSYDWSLTMDYAKAQLKVSYDHWFHGFSDISFSNPLSQLKHYARKTHLAEKAMAAGITGKFDFNKHSLELIIPIVSKESQLNIKRDTSTYISSSVLITDRDDEFSCPICGYQYATKPDSKQITRRSEDSTFKHLGLSRNILIYNCDLPRILQFSDISDLLLSNVSISSCGTMESLKSDASVSQIELFVDVDDNKLLTSASSPWYFSPGFQFNFDGYLGLRKSLNQDLNTLGKINVILTSSQGHFLNEGRVRLTIRLDDNQNFNICLDSKSTFPNIADTHFPTKVTDFKLFHDLRMSFGKFKDELCTKPEHSFDIRLTADIPQEYLDKLEQDSRNSKCAKQMRNPSFVYPSGSYLMTKNCIIELISKTSIRRLRLDFKSDAVPNDSLLMIYHTIESVRVHLKQKLVNRFALDVDVKSLSQIKDVLLNKTISFQIDIRDRDSQMALSFPNFYFPSEFVQPLIKNHYRVINVYPKLVLFNNKERKDLTASLNDWTLIANGNEETSYEIYVKLLEGDKLTFKLLRNSQELRLEPSVKKGVSSSNFTPRIFYNKYIDDFSERTFLKSNEDILFCLLKVDGYLVVHPTEIPVIIYYSGNSVTVLQETFLINDKEFNRSATPNVIKIKKI